MDFMKKAFAKVMKSKKGAQTLGELYSIVLSIVLIGIITSVGIVVIVNMEDTSAVTGSASTALNNTVSAIAPITSTWLSLIVTVAVLALILFLVIRGFGGLAGAGGR